MSFLPMPHLKRIVYNVCIYIIPYLISFGKSKQIPPLNISSVKSRVMPFFDTQRPPCFFLLCAVGERILFFFLFIIKEILFPVIILNNFPVVLFYRLYSGYKSLDFH